MRDEACGGVTMSAADDGLHELAVANPSFFVEKLGAECSDLQGVRELTVNGLQGYTAIARDIVKGHGGDITLSDSPMGGLRAAVRVPV